MVAAFVVAFLALCLVALFAWSFRHLPGERWQVLATLPFRREANGVWRGLNLTYYGLFNSLGVAAAVALAAFLEGTVGLPVDTLTWGVVAVLAICIPASKIVNRIVEGHWHGFTVGGASFAGMLVAPWLTRIVLRFTMPGYPSGASLCVLGAIASGYALGEGIGRLACISFGCCYGRRLSDCSTWLQKLFNSSAFIFEGRLKKASYECGFEGQRLIPVQALTAIISSSAGLAGVALYLCGRPMLAYVLPIAVTQVWRFLSEFLRADYRGAGRITAYQWMALAGAGYTVALALVWHGAQLPAPNVARGLALLWTPGTIVLIEVIAFFVFVRMGVSTVTASRVAFEFRSDMAMSPQSLKGEAEGCPIAHAHNS